MRFAGLTAADWYTLSVATAPSDPRIPTGSAEGNAEFALSGLEFTDGASASATVREAGLRLDVARGSQNLWDASASLSLSDLSTSGFQNDEDVTIGEVGIDSQARDFPLARWQELADRFALDRTGGVSARSEQQRRELSEALRGVRWGAGGAEFALTRGAVGPSAAVRFRLDEGSFRVTFDGREELLSLAYGLGVQGLFVADSDVPAELLPRTAGVEVAIENLPPEVLVLPMMAAIESGGDGQAVAGAILGEIFASEVAPSLLVEDFGYDADVLGVSGSGRVTAEPASPGGFEGEFEVALRRLDRFEAFAAAAEHDDTAWAQGAISAACVAALREVGEPGPPAADGEEPPYGYHVTLSADGTALANGVPLAALVERCGEEGWRSQRFAAFEAADAGSDATAEAHFKGALARAERFESGDTRLADSLGDLGIFYAERGRGGEALPLLARAAALRERALGADHPDLAFNLWWLGRNYAALGRNDEAEARLRDALAIDETALGRGSLDVAWDLDALAVLYRDQARYDEAETAFERVMAIADAKLSETDDDLAHFLENYAALKRATGRAAEAAAMEARAAAIRAR